MVEIFWKRQIFSLEMLPEKVTFLKDDHSENIFHLEGDEIVLGEIFEFFSRFHHHRYRRGEPDPREGISQTPLSGVFLLSPGNRSLIF